jgi:hypothetical protein
LIFGLELEVEARLAGPRFGHRGDELTVAGFGLIGGVPERCNLAIATDELRQPAPGRWSRVRSGPRPVPS